MQCAIVKTQDLLESKKWAIETIRNQNSIIWQYFYFLKIFFADIRMGISRELFRANTSNIIAAHNIISRRVNERCIIHN